MTTGKFDIEQFVKDMASRLSVIEGVLQSQAVDTLTESIPEVPLIQTYWSDINLTSGTDRWTMGGGGTKAIKQKVIGFVIDVYVRQRSSIGEDMSAIHRYIDPITDMLENEDDKPYFGNQGIDSFTWSAERSTFSYGDIDYAGIRFTLSVHTM